MSSNVLFTTMTPVVFFDRFPVTGIYPIAAPVPVVSTGDKIKRKLGLQATPPPPPPSLKGDSVASQGIVSSGARVGIGRFSHHTSTPGQLYSPNSGIPAKLDILMGDTTLPGIPMFYLPYADNNNFRLTLVDKQGTNAAFCTTALIDGCSIYVEGTQADPTIYHLNAQATNAAPVPVGSPPGAQRVADWAAKYAKMDSRFRGDALKLAPTAKGSRLPKRLRQMHPNLLVPGKLENHDYMIAPANSAAFEGTLAALQGAGKARTQVGGVSVDEMMLLATQGTMFGVKTGGLWRMYVQRRALVEYFHVNLVPPHTPLGRQWIVRDVQEFWPTANVGTHFASIW